MYVQYVRYQFLSVWKIPNSTISGHQDTKNQTDVTLNLIIYQNFFNKGTHGSIIIDAVQSVFQQWCPELTSFCRFP